MAFGRHPLPDRRAEDHQNRLGSVDFASWSERAAATGRRTCRAEYGTSAREGLLLHVGQTLEWLAPDILAAPWWSVL